MGAQDKIKKEKSTSFMKNVAMLMIAQIVIKILGFIYVNSESRDIFQKSIEEEFDIRRSSVTSVLTLMEKNELIKRISVSEDARLKKIILTEKGIEVNKLVCREINEIEKIIYNNLSKEELDSFISNLDKLLIFFVFLVPL